MSACMYCGDSEAELNAEDVCFDCFLQHRRWTSREAYANEIEARAEFDALLAKRGASGRSSTFQQDPRIHAADGDCVCGAKSCPQCGGFAEGDDLDRLAHEIMERHNRRSINPSSWGDGEHWRECARIELRRHPTQRAQDAEERRRKGL